MYAFPYSNGPLFRSPFTTKKNSLIVMSRQKFIIIEIYTNNTSSTMTISSAYTATNKWLGKYLPSLSKYKKKHAHITDNANVFKSGKILKEMHKCVFARMSLDEIFSKQTSNLACIKRRHFLMKIKTHSDLFYTIPYKGFIR